MNTKCACLGGMVWLILTLVCCAPVGPEGPGISVDITGDWVSEEPPPKVEFSFLGGGYFFQVLSYPRGQQMIFGYYYAERNLLTLDYRNVQWSFEDISTRVQGQQQFYFQVEGNTLMIGDRSFVRKEPE